MPDPHDSHPERDRKPPAPAARPSPGARLVLALIGGYRRFISPLLGPSCRFLPTCSDYAAQAVQRYGALRGSWLALCRLLRCHPFCTGGMDPLPERFSWWRPNTNRDE